MTSSAPNRDAPEYRDASIIRSDAELSAEARAKHSYLWLTSASPSVSVRDAAFQRTRFLPCLKGGRYWTHTHAIHMLYQADRHAAHLRPESRPGSSIDQLLARPDPRDQDRGPFNALPPELLVRVFAYLSDDDARTLGLVSMSFLRLVGSGPFQGIEQLDAASRLGFLAMLENTMPGSKGTKHLPCRACLVLHPHDYFSTVDRFKSPHPRFRGPHNGACFLLAPGCIELSPQVRFTWVGMQHMPNDSRRSEYAMLWSKPDSPLVDKPRKIGNKKSKLQAPFDDTAVHVLTTIHKTSHKVCVHTRYEFPALVAAARRRAQWPALTAIPRHILEVCPHNPLGAAKWATLDEADCTAEGHDPQGCDCHEGRVVRCLHCLTDAWYGEEMLVDGRACYVVQTWKILGRDDDWASKEWRAQGEESGRLHGRRCSWSQSAEQGWDQVWGGAVRTLVAEVMESGIWPDQESEFEALWAPTERHCEWLAHAKVPNRRSAAIARVLARMNSFSSSDQESYRD